MVKNNFKWLAAFALLFVSSGKVWAQQSDIAIVDAQQNEVADSMRYVCNAVEETPWGAKLIDLGLSAVNKSEDAAQYLQLSYELTDISGGYLEVCFDGQCLTLDGKEKKAYDTELGAPDTKVMPGMPANLATEYYPEADDNACKFVLTIYQCKKVGSQWERTRLKTLFVEMGAKLTGIAAAIQAMPRTACYDLQGKRVNAPTKSGVYLVPQRDAQGKISYKKQLKP